MITICSPSIARSAISPRRCFASLMDTVVDIREFSLLLDEKQPFFRPGPFAPVPKACPPWRVTLRNATWRDYSPSSSSFVLVLVLVLDPLVPKACPPWRVALGNATPRGSDRG